VALTNTILVSHTVGITVTAGNTATLNGVLWYSNTINYGGVGTITVTNEYTGDPAFAADGYHLTTSSAAIDRGVDTGVKTDIDGHPRPLSGGADIGADEVGQMLIPLYIYPDTGSVGSRWDQVISASDQISITAIINPNSGPGGCPPDSAYETGINDLRNAGVTIVGYVDTNYGERDAELYVKPDVDLYNQCFGIDGIFFDRVASSAIKISYYEDLYDYVKSKDNLDKVFLNPGTHIDEVYLSLPAGDTAVIFEGYSWDWPGYEPDNYVSTYPAERFAMLVHSVCAIEGADTMRSHIHLAMDRNIGYVYVTDDTPPNPWDTLPFFWLDEIEYIASPYAVPIIDKFCLYLPLILKNSNP
jgi:hypothetical protein